jgi:probable HAF family extracellular repeat protein
LKKLLLSLLAFCIVLGGSPLPAQVSFHLVPQPTGPTWQNFALSYDGKTMAADFGGELFLWKKGQGFKDLGPGDQFTTSIGISGDGSTVTSTISNPDGSSESGIWRKSTGWVHLGHPANGCQLDQNWDSGYSLNYDGSMLVGLTWYCPGAQGFEWTATGGFVTLSHPPGGHASSRASAISADGSSIVGFYESPTQGFRRPVRWKSRQPNRPDLFAGIHTPGEATSVSSDGSQIVGQAADASGFPRAFYYTEAGGLVDIGTLSGNTTDESSANAISDDGTVVGWSGDPFFLGVKAFIWKAKHPTSRPVSLKAWLQYKGVFVPKNLTLVTAITISGDGSTIVGTWQDPNYNTGTWIARLR